MKARPKATLVETVARSAAVLAAIGCLCLWAVFLWYNPYRPPDGPAARLIGSVMIAAWIVGLVATWRQWLGGALAVFVVAFLPVGLYLLGTPGLFAWIGILTLLYLAATLVWHRSRSRRRALDDRLALGTSVAEPGGLKHEPVPEPDDLVGGRPRDGSR